YAAPQATTPVTLTNIHVGDGFAAAGVSIANGAANDGFSEKLDAAFGTLSGVSTNAGTIGLLGPGTTDNSSLTVNLTASTATAGLKTGTAAVDFVSNGQGTSGLGTTSAGSQTVTVNG